MNSFARFAGLVVLLGACTSTGQTTAPSTPIVAQSSSVGALPLSSPRGTDGSPVRARVPEDADCPTWSAASRLPRSAEVDFPCDGTVGIAEAYSTPSTNATSRARSPAPPALAGR